MTRERRKKIKREIVAKASAMISTLSFMALVRTNADPELWQIAFTTLVLYESIVIGIQVMCFQSRKSKKRKRIRLQQQDARRWAEEWFNPLREVS